ncbi:hypothetical protein [Desulfoluna butyratoxydans]|uniref:hypothetical protein n=1 Tax=Desulfoluna butyratoxydans TaxID=231438 RepID=UPI0015D278C0|nr:hypothetical protein [Desulfoluna butyratoxydans]
MNLSELQIKLNELMINPDAYSLKGDACDECYVISCDGPGTWVVYYSERGLRSSCKTFKSESDACKEFLKRLKKDPTVL